MICVINISMLMLVVGTALLGSAKACSVTGIEVGESLNGFPQAVIDKETGLYLLYGKDQVRAHFTSKVKVDFAPMATSMYACVDSRGTTPQLGTPGGDLAEIIAGMLAWFNLRNRAVNSNDMKALFDAFFNRIASPRRPLYFHTDDSRLKQMFAQLGKDGVLIDNMPPSVLPETAPTDAGLRSKWLAALTDTRFQGCGHIRLMLDPATAPYYSIPRSGLTNTSCAAAGVTGAKCLGSTAVASEMIRLFYESWWTTPVGSAARQKVRWQVDVGPLVGKAVTVISHNRRGSCRNVAPLVAPNYAGSTVFVYHGEAAALFRRFITRRLAGGLGVTAADWEKAWNEVAQVQLVSTLTYLSPPNKVGLYPVTVQTA